MPWRNSTTASYLIGLLRLTYEEFMNKIANSWPIETEVVTTPEVANMVSKTTKEETSLEAIADKCHHRIKASETEELIQNLGTSEVVSMKTATQEAIAEEKILGN